ncbi:MAG TPA: hypothetical protein DIU39_08620 [Flavobacteriales bacterium]|nr:hypothetical protein [Flavobacteriales bacterium]|tara:strand:- start:87066 stop:87299 length:234 start_codon:yes stop_codon:yes gene_type:complete
MEFKEEYKPLLVALLVCLTLGLAPYSPEPHIVGKLRWIMGGAIGMKPMDWFDTLLHGAPWVYLLFEIGKLVVNKIKG